MSSPSLYTRSCIQWWRRAYMRVMAGFIQEMFQQMDEKGEVYSCIYKIPFTHFFFQLLHLL